MKILTNEIKPVIPEWPKAITCRNCKSKLEIEKEEITKGTMFYSEREIDHNVKGVTCPCCNQFTAL